MNTNPAAQFQQAFALHRAGRVSEAARLYETLLSALPGHAPLLDLYGTALVQLGRPAEGVEKLRAAVHAAPGQPIPLTHLGTALGAAGRQAEALDYLDQALAIRPDFIEAVFARANTLMALNRMAEALTGFETLSRLAPAMPAAHYNRAGLLAATGRAEEALAAYGMAIALAPDIAAAYNNRAAVLISLTRYDEALADYDRVLAREKSPAAFTNRARLLHRMGRLQDALAATKQALSLSPGDGAALTEHGALLLEMNRGPEAEQMLRAAVAATPSDASAHNNLGNALTACGRPAEALTAFNAAIAIAPGMAAAHSNRANALAALGRFEDAIAGFEQALALQPGYADALANMGLAWRSKGETDKAMACFDRALASDPGHADAAFDKAHLLLLTGHLEDGFALYEARWRRAQFARIVWTRPEPMWRGEDIRGKRLLIRHEQGLGDFLMTCRYAPLAAARGAGVIVAAPPPLRNFVSTLKNVTVIGETDDPGPIDYHCPMMSLPHAFATSQATIPATVPYLSADPDRCARWRTELGPKRRLRVGLVVSGDAHHLNDANRSIALAHFAPLLTQPCDFHLLQPDLRDTDRATAATYGLHQHTLTDFADTAALMTQMDLIISVDSAPAHAAGAIGAPLWILLPFLPDWRWQMGRADSPWYPTAELFRQPAAGDWDSVIEKLCAALLGRIQQ